MIIFSRILGWSIFAYYLAPIIFLARQVQFFKWQNLGQKTSKAMAFWERGEAGLIAKFVYFRLILGQIAISKANGAPNLQTFLRD
jgi:hypothetical protein